MIQYSQTICWHERDGTYVEYGVQNCETYRAAILSAMRLARRHGWTKPRWWQWWRWGDYDYSELEAALDRAAQ